VPAGPGRAANEGHAVGAHFKSLEKQGLADSSAAGYTHHFYLGWNLDAIVLKILIGGVRPPGA